MGALCFRVFQNYKAVSFRKKHCYKLFYLLVGLALNKFVLSNLSLLFKLVDLFAFFHEVNQFIYAFVAMHILFNRFY